MKPRDIIGVIARCTVGGILAYAGFMKAMAPSAEFAAVLEAYKLFPSALLTPLSIGLPYVEMWVGLFLMTGLYTRWAALAAAFLGTSFFLSVGSTLLRHIDLATCGCLGSESLKPQQTMILDIFIVALSIAIYRLSRAYPRWSLDQALS